MSNMIVVRVKFSEDIKTKFAIDQNLKIENLIQQAFHLLQKSISDLEDVSQYQISDSDGFVLDTTEVIKNIIQPNEELIFQKKIMVQSKIQNQSQVQSTNVHSTMQPHTSTNTTTVNNILQNMNTVISSNPIILDTFLLIKPKNEKFFQNEEQKIDQNDQIINIYLKFPQFTLNLEKHNLPYHMTKQEKKYLVKVKNNRKIINFMTDMLDLLGINEKLTVCMYSDDGNSILPDLHLNVDAKISDLINNLDTYYCIFSNSQVVEEQAAADPSLGPDQLLISYSGTNMWRELYFFFQILCLKIKLIPHIVNVDLEHDKVKLLRQKVSTKLNIPYHLIGLSYGSKYLKDDSDQTLKEYNIQKNSQIFVTIKNVAGLSTEKSIPIVSHTIEGLRSHKSHIYILSRHINTANLQKKFLGLIRDISVNNTPLLVALNLLFESRSLNIFNNIALEEGFYNIYLSMVFKTENPGQNITPLNIFQYSRFTFLQNLSNPPQLWLNQEKYKIYDSACSVTYSNITQPVYYTKKDNTKVICDKDSLQNYHKNSEEKDSQLKTEEDEQLNKIFKQMKQLRLSEICKWEGTWQTPANESNIFCMNKNWEQVNTTKTFWDTNPEWKLYNPLELKGNPPTPCLTENYKKELLIYIGKNKDPAKPIYIRDILLDQEFAVNPDEMVDPTSFLNKLNQISQQNSKNKQNSSAHNLKTLTDMINNLPPAVINREPKEAIVVVLDVSGSMGEEFTSGLQRIGAVKAFFNAFADRTMAYDFKHIISLIFFDSTVRKVQNFTDVFTQFKQLVDFAFPNTMTKLYDALDLGINDLLEIKKKYKDIIPRIIALTDGVDNQSHLTQVQIAKRIIQNDIILDSFVVGDECEELKAITLASGGKCFFPKDLQEGINFFEVETILSAGIRVNKADEKEQIKKNLDSIEDQLASLSQSEFSTEHHHFQLPQKVHSKVSEPNLLINKNQDLQVSINMKLKRIIKELKDQMNNPHPNIRVYPCENDITFWKLILMGPENTPYHNGVFNLYMQFPENYPAQPPEIRFLTEIYHCNINSSGRICHSVLDRNYTTDTTISLVFSCIFGLLLTPEPEDPLNSTIASEFMTNLETYRHKAQQMTNGKANQTVEQLVNQIFENYNQNDKDMMKRVQDFRNWFNELQKNQ